MRVPSSTPEGMETDRVFSFCTLPMPPQDRQGSRITLHEPWQLGQVRSTVKKPDWERTRPLPWQVTQVTGAAAPAAPVPRQESHWTEVGTRMLVFLPAKASVSVISMLKRRSVPWPLPRPGPRLCP